VRNSDGLLASVSDDTSIRIWDVHRGMCTRVATTGHTANVFAVGWIDEDGIATAGWDGQVRLTSIGERPGPVKCYLCHESRVKQLVTDPSCPCVFLTASEDGTVRQFDIRESHSCSRGCSNVVVDRTCSNAQMPMVRCLALSPDSTYLAIGERMVPISIFDRRQLSCRAAGRSSDTAVRILAPEVCPQFLRSARPTGVAFKPDGCALAVTYCDDHAYILPILEDSVDVHLHKEPEAKPDAVEDLVHTQKACFSMYSSTIASSTAVAQAPLSSVAQRRAAYMHRCKALLQRQAPGDAVWAAVDAARLVSEEDAGARSLGALACSRLCSACRERRRIRRALQADDDEEVPAGNDEPFFSDRPRGASPFVGPGAAAVMDEEESSSDPDSDVCDELSVVSNQASDDVGCPCGATTLTDIITDDTSEQSVRLVGHCHADTDIKEIVWWGSNAVCTGSDDGTICAYDARSGRLLRVLAGHQRGEAVNSIVCIPGEGLASSGIDDFIRLWTPSREDGHALSNPDMEEHIRRSMRMLYRSSEF